MALGILMALVLVLSALPLVLAVALPSPSSAKRGSQKGETPCQQVFESGKQRYTAFDKEDRA